MWNSFAKRTGRVQKVKYLSDVGVGDIVQIGGKHGERAMESHSMIVTKIDDAGPRVSYHTANKTNVPLWEVLRKYDVVKQPFSAWRTVALPGPNEWPF